MRHVHDREMEHGPNGLDRALIVRACCVAPPQGVKLDPKASPVPGASLTPAVSWAQAAPSAEWCSRDRRENTSGGARPIVSASSGDRVDVGLDELSVLWDVAGRDRMALGSRASCWRTLRPLPQSLSIIKRDREGRTAHSGTSGSVPVGEG